MVKDNRLGSNDRVLNFQVFLADEQGSLIGHLDINWAKDSRLERKSTLQDNKLTTV